MEQSIRVDLNHLQTFYWVARSGSFTEAARLLQLPKSTVSRQVAALEARLDLRLVQRTTRKVILTEIGSAYLEHCARVMAEAEEAERAATAYSAEPRGLLRIGVPVTFARSFLTPLLPGFCRSYPFLRLDLVLGSTTLDPVEARLDVVLRVGPLADSSLTVRHLGSMTQALFAGPGYPSLPQHPSELTRHRVFAISRSARGATWTLRRGPETCEIRVEPEVAVADPVICHSLVQAGLGIAALPVFLTRTDPTLRPVLADWSFPAIDFSAVYPSKRGSAPKLRVFLEYLAAHLQLS